MIRVDCPATEKPPWLSKIQYQLKVKVNTLDIVPLRSESALHKCSGMACVPKGSQSFTGIPTRPSASGMSHTCFCLPSYSWNSFTDPGGLEG